MVLLEAAPICTEKLLELCLSDHGVFGHLRDQGPSPPIAQFGQVASSRKSVGGSKLLPFKQMEATVFFGTFKAAEMFWYPSPFLCLDTILSLISTHNSFDLMAWFFSLTCTVNCRTLYTQVCAFPNHAQSIECTTGGLQSSCRNVSRMINGNRMHLSSMSSLITTGSEY